MSPSARDCSVDAVKEHIAHASPVDSLDNSQDFGLVLLWSEEMANMPTPKRGAPMGERNIVLDQPVVMNEQTEALRHATERADRLEAELAKLKGEKVAGAKTPGASSAKDQERLGEEENESISLDGLEELRKDSMMVHLLDSLEAGKDIGHYGRLVFVMVARHFLAPDEVLRYLSHDKDFSEEQALLMVRQVEERDYNPPKRERILEWQSQQDFPILPKPDDPDCGNVYRNLKFPTEIYEHISHYQEEKLSSGE